MMLFTIILDILGMIYHYSTKIKIDSDGSLPAERGLNLQNVITMMIDI